VKRFSTPLMFVLVGLAAALTGHTAVWLAMSILIVLWMYQERRRHG